MQAKLYQLKEHASVKSNHPNASKVLTSLISCGYTFPTAILDLIDNSVDALATQVTVNLISNKHNQYVVIADNGKGMTKEVLDQALRLGSDTTRTAGSFGKFGMGLVTSSISIGRRVTIITKSKGGQLLQSTQDLDEVESTNKFIKTLSSADQFQRNLWNIYLFGQESGTLVLISKIDPKKHKVNIAMRDKLKLAIGQTYRKLTANVDFQLPMLIDKTLGDATNLKHYLKVEPIDPLYESESKILLDGNHVIETDGVKIPIRIKVAQLPYQHEARSLSGQGFYMMRNGREVAAGETLGLYTRHNNYNAFRAEIYFDDKSDEKFNVNFMKQRVDISNKDILTFIDVVTAPIRSQIKEEEKKIAGLGAASNDCNLKNDDVLNKIINSLKKELEIKSTKSKASTKQTKDKTESKPRAKQNKENDKKVNKSVDLEILWNYISEPEVPTSLYSFDYSDNTLEITLNVAHAFYLAMQNLGVDGDLMFKVMLVGQLVAQLKQSSDEDNISEVLSGINEHTGLVLDLIINRLN